MIGKPIRTVSSGTRAKHKIQDAFCQAISATAFQIGGAGKKVSSSSYSMQWWSREKQIWSCTSRVPTASGIPVQSKQSFEQWEDMFATALAMRSFTTGKTSRTDTWMPMATLVFSIVTFTIAFWSSVLNRRKKHVDRYFTRYNHQDPHLLPQVPLYPQAQLMLQLHSFSLSSWAPGWDLKCPRPPLDPSSTVPWRYHSNNWRVSAHDCLSHTTCFFPESSVAKSNDVVPHPETMMESHLLP